MAIEWAAISAAVGAYLKKYAKNRIEKLASEQADGALAKLYRRFVPDKNLEEVNRIFVTRFQKELDSAIDLPTLNTEPYRDALRTFLCNDYVQDALQAPLDGKSELDGKLLDGIWKEVRASGGGRLIKLPEDFDWAKLARLHGKSVRSLMVTSSELRPVIATLAAIRAADASERTATAAERMAGPARAFDLPRYAEAIKKAYTYLKVGSIDTDWTEYERRIPLEGVYVPQSVKEALPPRDLTRDYLQLLRQEKRAQGITEDEVEAQRRKEEYRQLTSRRLMEVVDDPAHERLVILGDPGLGKSTLLKSLALRWAGRPQAPLTLLIELRKASRAAGYANFLDYVEKGADPICCLPRVELDRHLKDQASVVLFDGLDEVTEPSRTHAVGDIIRFAADYSKARILVTTRIHGYYPGSTYPEQFRDAGFRQFTLQDFDDPEIGDFIGRWHLAAFQDLEERTRYESRLRGALEDSPAIRELAANPLLLTMMAILNRNQELPRYRGRLYERCAELLLKNWDLEKFPERRDRKEARDIMDKLGPDQKMRILERVAEAMQKERTGLAGNQIAQDKLKQIVQDELTDLPGVRQPWSVADDLIWMLRERNFMLGYLGDRQYTFIHRTFLEYFCARDLKYRLEKTSGLTVDALVDLFRARWRQDEWQEVLRLLCGLIGAEHASKCISELLVQGGHNEGHGAVLLAAQCMREVSELGTVRQVRSVTKNALVGLSRYDLPFYYEPRDHDGLEVSRIRGSAVQELARGWKDDPETLRWLKERVSQDSDEEVRYVAVQELARGWKNDLETLGWLKECVNQDRDEYVRRAAVEELAWGWKDDPETLWLLKERLSQDDDGSVRYAAVQELAGGWKDDPDTLRLLKERVSQDSDGVVRQAAVGELARGWKDDPETLWLLKERLSQDDDGSVRQAAVEELAREWKDDPDTLRLLKERMSQDSNGVVRQAAARELALGWKDDPETLRLLKERVSQDDHPFVRAAAVRELARGWRDDPETPRLLKERVSQDRNEYVRQAAVRELARGWNDDPETLRLLKERASQDSDRHVRQGAVQELARGWKDDPDTPRLLKERASRDSNGYVRRAAVQELARGWKDDPDTVRLLKERVREDDDPNVRRAAVRELAQGWMDDPDTVRLLKERASQDDDEDVQQAAIEELRRRWRDDAEIQDFLGGLPKPPTGRQSSEKRGPYPAG